jgi:hypothetical protein
MGSIIKTQAIPRVLLVRPSVTHESPIVNGDMISKIYGVMSETKEGCSVV